MVRESALVSIFPAERYGSLPEGGGQPTTLKKAWGTGCGFDVRVVDGQRYTFQLTFILPGYRFAPVMNRPVAVTEIHILAFAGSHCSAFAASDHSPHKLTSEENSCPTELYRARKLLFAVIAFDKTDWFRHRQALS